MRCDERSLDRAARGVSVSAGVCKWDVMEEKGLVAPHREGHSLLGDNTRQLGGNIGRKGEEYGLTDFGTRRAWVTFHRGKRSVTDWLSDQKEANMTAGRRVFAFPGVGQGVMRYTRLCDG